MSSIFDMIDDFGKKTTTYSNAEIDAARKIAKKTGQSVMEVLQEMSAQKKESAKRPQSTASSSQSASTRPQSTASSSQSASTRPQSTASSSQSAAKKPQSGMTKPQTGMTKPQSSITNPLSSLKRPQSTPKRPASGEGMMDDLLAQAQAYNSTMEELLANMQKDQQAADDLSSSMNQMLSDLQAQNQKELESLTSGQSSNSLTSGLSSDSLTSGLSSDSLTSGLSSDSLTSGQAICDTTQKDLEELRRNMAKDFGIISEKELMGTKTPSEEPEPAKKKAGIEAFGGVEDVISEKVFGQKTLLKKLTVAFKRPFILPEEENHAKNCFYIHGPKDSGKHYALEQITAELAGRGILSNPSVYKMDLSRYTAAGKDNVFLQDLYMALQSESNVILFENFEDCHISYLSYLNDLVTKGECYLQDRYMLQKGQLVGVANAFTRETVSTFTAAGKYLAFISTKNVENLANVFGAPFVNSLGDICVSEKLTDESYKKIAKVHWDALLEKTKNQLSFELQAEEDPILDAAVAATAKNAGTEGLIGFFEKLLKALATIRLEGDYASGTKVALSIEDSSLMAQIGEEKLDLMDNLPASYTGNVASVKAELDNIVGLAEIKKYILSLEEYYNTQKRRTEAGLKASEVSKHMIFTGNPGTGKTTIARIISRYLKAIGILSGGQLVEVSRADLVGRFVGHTAPLVNQVVKSALGGVLFIDEAYSLYRGKDDAFGLEAIDTLVKAMEDNRDNLIVVLAGYSNEMEYFLEANSGLKSRFPNIINFPDYSGEELLQITDITVKSKGYVLDEGAREPLLAYYIKVQAFSADDAGNGRLVRNKVEEAILNQSRRLVAEPEADLSLLLAEDFVLE